MSFVHLTPEKVCTKLEQWKAFRHRPLWVAVVNRNEGKRVPSENPRGFYVAYLRDVGCFYRAIR